MLRGARALRADVASFNLENDPRHAGQGPAALAEIEALGVSAVAVQEILDPARFAREAREHLGERWEFVWAEAGGPQRVGVLYDSEALELSAARVHTEGAAVAAGAPGAGGRAGGSRLG